MYSDDFPIFPFKRVRHVFIYRVNEFAHPNEFLFEFREWPDADEVRLSVAYTHLRCDVIHASVLHLENLTL